MRAVIEGRLVRWATTLAQIFLLPSGVHRIQAVLTYIAGVAGAPPSGVPESIMSQLPTEAPHVTKTWAETLSDEGIAIDILRLLRQKFGAAVTPDHEDRVRGGSADELVVWLMRILTADSVEEVLADRQTDRFWIVPGVAGGTSLLFGPAIAGACVVADGKE